MNKYTLKNKVNRLPKISMKNPKMLYDLHDFLKESAKENEQYATLLSYYDSSSGVSPIISKLPGGLQGKWVYKASKYMCFISAIQLAKFIR